MSRAAWLPLPPGRFERTRERATQNTSLTMLNAFVATAPVAAAGGGAAAAAAAAGLREGVLRGCAVAVKANLCAAGWPATAGSKMLARVVTAAASSDASADFILLGQGALVWPASCCRLSMPSLISDSGLRISWLRQSACVREGGRRRARG